MPDYAALYYKLFNAITDAITILQTVQQETEKMFVEDDPTIDLSDFL